DLLPPLRHDLAALDAAALPRRPAHGTLLEEADAARLRQPAGDRPLRHRPQLVAAADRVDRRRGQVMAASEILVNGVFYAFALVAIAGAVGVAASRKLVRSAFALIAGLFSEA